MMSRKILMEQERLQNLEEGWLGGLLGFILGGPVFGAVGAGVGAGVGAAVGLSTGSVAGLSGATLTGLITGAVTGGVTSVNLGHKIENWMRYKVRSELLKCDTFSDPGKRLTCTLNKLDDAIDEMEKSKREFKRNTEAYKEINKKLKRYKKDFRIFARKAGYSVKKWKKGREVK